jgi:RNA polymerase sigma factor (TIGR02999 family)
MCDNSGVSVQNASGENQSWVPEGHGTPPRASENPTPGDDLFHRLYDQLREMADRQIRREQPGLTLQPTALVHEAYLRLSATGQIWPSERYLFAAAAEAMRRILIERARRASRHKHGGGCRRESLDDANVAQGPGDPDALLALHEALEELRRQDPDLAGVVMLRYFAGLTIERIAQLLDRSERSVKYDWAAARAWLIRRMDSGGGDRSDP